MKRINRVKGALLAGVLTFALALSAGAVDLGIGTVKGDGLRLRTEPNLQGSILAEAAKGQLVTVLEKAGDWYKVDFATQVGYMSGAYLNVSTDMEADLGYGKVKTKGDALNLRAGAGTGHSVVASMSNGSVVELKGFRDGWYKLTYNGTTGYASSDYIIPVQDASGTRADTAASAAPAGSDLGQAIVNEAMKYLGYRYVSGGAGPSGFDCCGFTQYVYKQVTGQTMPRTCDGQLYKGPGVRVDCALEDCQPGDLLFRGNEPGRPGVAHVAICLGDMKIIHASTPSTGVIITDMKKNGNYAKYYMGVRRLG